MNDQEQANNKNKYKDKYIEEKFKGLFDDVKDIKKSVEILNKHSNDTVIKLTKIEDKIDPIQKIVYGLIALILIAVVGALLGLVLI